MCLVLKKRTCSMQEDGDEPLMDGCLKRALIGLVRVVTRQYRKWPGSLQRETRLFSRLVPRFGAAGAFWWGLWIVQR